MQHHLKKIAVLGGGSFGTALASIAAEKNTEVFQWVRTTQQAKEINETHRNPRYLPDFKMNPKVIATTDFAMALEQAQLVLVAIPSKYFRNIIHQASAWINAGTILVSTAKGIEVQGFKLMSQVLSEETISKHIGVLSGPNLAAEISERQLTASVIASADEFTRKTVQEALSNDYFRIYANIDRYGVELAGALKNIYAIAVGMAAALGMGENTKSMLITRALAEMSRFAVSQGANPLTFLGLAGVGDLIVTCSSTLSRNFQIGYAIGKGESLHQAVKQLGQVAEGINTIRLVYSKAQKDKIYMPLVSGLYQVLYEQMAPIEIAKTLMRGDLANDVEFLLPTA